MADALDNMFSVIMKSEMIAQAGKQKYKEVKDANESLTLRLKKQECKRAKHVAKKSQLELAIADANIAIKILKAKEEQTTYGLKVIEENVGIKKTRFDDMSKNLVVKHEEFIENVKTFSADYGLSSSGTERRLHCAKECLKSLELDKDILEADVEVIKNDNGRLRMLLNEKSKAKAELDALACNVDEIDKEIGNQACCAKELGDNISRLIIEPDCGSKFVRANEELRVYEASDLQFEIDKLKSELTLMTRKLQRKEAQSLRLQYKLWQRQQNQKNASYAQKESLPETSDTERSHSDTDLFVEEDVISISDEDIKQEM